MNAIKRNTIYWLVTSLIIILLLTSAIPSVLMLPFAVEHFTIHLGYPKYLLVFTGIAKLLGIAALLFPVPVKLKELAYAGIIFDLSGALFSSISVNDPLSSWISIIIGLALTIYSYSLYYIKIKVQKPERKTFAGIRMTKDSQITNQ